MAEQIRRVAVWSGWLRLVHLLLGLATLALIATGWLITHAPTQAQAAADYHWLAAGVLVAALLLRLWRGLFGRGPERFDSLWPTASEWSGVRASAVFYLSLGRAPLPNWYAHNPLWKPLYLAWFALLVLAALSGALMPDRPLVLGIYLPHLHAGLADAVGMLILLHLLSVGLQDWRGQGADASAMLSGNRYFSVDRGLVRPQVRPVSIHIDDIDKGRP